VEDQRQGFLEGSRPSFVVQDGVFRLGGRRQVDEPGKASYPLGDCYQREDLESGRRDPGAGRSTGFGIIKS